MDRRKLLKAAAAAPAVPLLLSSPAEAAPAQPRRFAIAVLPDTQYLFDGDAADPAPLRETFRYLVSERAAVFLTRLGDITEHGTEQEIALASETFRGLDGKLPYSVLAGNHDVSGDDTRGATPYLRTMGPRRFGCSNREGRLGVSQPLWGPTDRPPGGPGSSPVKPFSSTVRLL